MAKRIGKYTIQMENMPSIEGYASVCGKKEAEGPLGKFFDQTFDDTTLGESSWEKAESKIIKETVNMNIMKAKVSSTDINYCFAGDLLNQCISSSFGLRELRYSPLWNFWSMFNIC